MININCKIYDRENCHVQKSNRYNWHICKPFNISFQEIIKQNNRQHNNNPANRHNEKYENQTNNEFDATASYDIRCGIKRNERIKTWCSYGDQRHQAAGNQIGRQNDEQGCENKIKQSIKWRGKKVRRKCSRIGDNDDKNWDEFKKHYNNYTES